MIQIVHIVNDIVELKTTKRERTGTKPFGKNQTLCYCIRLNILILLYIGNVRRIFVSMNQYTKKNIFHRKRIHLCCTICTFLIACYVCGREAPNISDSMHKWFTESNRLWCVWRQTITNNSIPHNNTFFSVIWQIRKCGNVKIHHNVHCCQLPVAVCL